MYLREPARVFLRWILRQPVIRRRSVEVEGRGCEERSCVTSLLPELSYVRDSFTAKVGVTSCAKRLVHMCKLLFALQLFPFVVNFQVKCIV